MRLLTIFIIIIIFIGCHSSKNKTRTWSIYKADNESTSYSALDEINLKNISQLQPAWTFKFKDAFDTAQTLRSECNPVIIDGIMYATSGRHRVYAINASTGEQVWTFDPFNGAE